MIVTSSCVENGVDYIFGQWLVLKLAHSALGTNRIRYIHISPHFEPRSPRRVSEDLVSLFLCELSALCGK